MTRLINNDYIYLTIKTNTMKATVNFYEGSYPYNSIETELNVTEDFIEMKLASQYEYRSTTETLWATVIKEGEEISRFKFNPSVYGLEQIIF